MSERLQGVLWRLVAHRGFGFLRTPGIGGDVFVHCDDVGWFFCNLRIGDVLEFALVQDDSGRYRAEDVELIEQASDQRVSGRIVEIVDDRYAFARVNGGDMFFASADVEGTIRSLTVGEGVSGRVVHEPGKKRPRLIEVRREP
jgi:cold shock CspA family protein